MAKLVTTTTSIPTSRHVIEPVSGSHRMEIKGYSLSRGIGVGKYYMSDIFTVGRYKWAIRFYPDGDYLEKDPTYVSIFIVLIGGGTKVRALYQINMVAQTGNMDNLVKGSRYEPVIFKKGFERYVSFFITFLGS